MTQPHPNSTSPVTSRMGWVASFGFWLCLLVAAGLYASVSLSPKFLTWLKLDRQYRENQSRMVMLEEQVSYLGRVIDALENEEEFTEQLARVEFDAARPDDERIPVERRLSLAAQVPNPDKARSVASLPWYTPLVEQMSSDQKLRRITLGVAAGLILVSFTFFEVPMPQTAEQKSKPGTSGKVYDRYARRDSNPLAR